MTILNTVRGVWASRRRHEREAYADEYGYATPQEVEAIKGGMRRRRFAVRVGGAMPRGRGMSPTGTPIDFTADEEPPRR